MPTLKIGFIGQSCGTGGAERWSHLTAKYLDRTKYSCSGFAFELPPGPNRPLEAALQSIAPVNYGQSAVAQLLLDSDIVIMWGVQDVGQYLKPNRKCRIILSSHTDSENTPAGQYTSNHLLASDNVEGIIAVSAAATTIISPHLSYAIIPNRIEPNRTVVTQDKATTKSEYSIPQNSKIALFMGRMSIVDKNPLPFVDAISLLPPEWYGLMLGEGNDKPTIKQYASTSGRVVVSDFRDDIGNIFAISDVLVSTSNTEGSSYTILEAAHSGTPIISTVTGLLSEEPNLARQLPPNPTAQDIAAAILEDEQDKTNTAKRTIAAWKTVHDKYLIDGSKWNDYLDNVSTTPIKPFAIIPHTIRPLSYGGNTLTHLTDAQLGLPFTRCTTFGLYVPDTYDRWAANTNNSNIVLSLYQDNPLDQTAGHSADYACLQALLFTPGSEQQVWWEWTGTWEDLGMLPNTYITTVQLQSFWYKSQVFNGYSIFFQFSLYDDTETFAAELTEPVGLFAETVGTWEGWTPVAAGDVDNIATYVPVYLQPSGSTIKIRILISIDPGALTNPSLIIEFAQIQMCVTSIVGTIVAPTQVTASITCDWNVLKSITGNLVSDWNVRRSITHSITSLWNTRAYVSATINSDWNDLVSLTKSVESEWNVLRSLITGFNSTWNVNAYVTQGFSSAWDVRASVSKSFNSLWNARALVTASHESEWNTRKWVSASVTSDWIVRQLTQFTPRPITTIDTFEANLGDLIARRGLPGGGFNPYRFLELFGADIIEPSMTEPDPATHRTGYYYNQATDRLYRRVYSRYEPENGIIVAYWKGVSS